MSEFRGTIVSADTSYDWSLRTLHVLSDTASGDLRTWCQLPTTKRTGGPFVRSFIPAEDRFWAKVNKDGPLPEFAPQLGPCWLWTAGLTKKGYGKFHPTTEKTVSAHVFMNGNAPEGLQWDHLCRVKHCVRRSHLEAVTGRENVRRQPARDRFAAARKAASRRRPFTHCVNGHEFTTENTYTPPDGERECRTCRSLRRRKT